MKLPAGPFDPKPLLSLLNDWRSRMRVLSGRDDAKGILLAVGIAAFFALAFYFGRDSGEQQTSVPACVDLCGDPVANATPETGHAAPAPATGHLQTDDQDRQPAPYIELYRRPPPDRHQPALTAKGNTAGIVVAPGVVTSRRTGARARVGVAHAARFQAYIDDLERNHGARVLFMGGIRPGHCASHSMHPCGRALDVCQLSRGVVDARCHLPPRRTLAQIAAAHGLFEGGRWCHSDYGHAQLGVTAGDCGDRPTHIVRRQMAPEARRASASVSYE